jgi:hypothetical protein
VGQKPTKEDKLHPPPPNLLAAQFNQGFKEMIKKKMERNPSMVSFQNDNFEVEDLGLKWKVKDYDKPWQKNTYLQKEPEPIKLGAGKPTLEQMKKALADKYYDEKALESRSPPK